MAIDFLSKINDVMGEKKVDPIEIYDDLDRTSTAGELRESQKYILKNWYSFRKEDRDLIIKMHTGEGKTLVGLLILLSKLNERKGPCIYVCPNKYLVSQVYEEAKKFGVPVCSITADNMLPNDFTNGERILVTNVHKLFNGKTIFGIGNDYRKIGAIVLDDAHACLDAIRDAFTISIKRRENHDLYQQILALFESELVDQGAGSFWDIKNGEKSETLMSIPYWAWIDKNNSVLELLAPHADENFIRFSWDLLKDAIDKCEAFVNGNEIQIILKYATIDKFSFFKNAENRILMSATTQDDIFFAKTLNFSIESIRSPLIADAHHWSGEKMILLPSLMSDKLQREVILDYFCNLNYKSFGAVALVPSSRRQIDYEKYGCVIVNKENIENEVWELKNGKYSNMMVFANRYDGIDLPDKTCRVLIMDSLPYFSNLADEYEEKNRVDSVLIHKKIAQRIEQGMGRCVRSEKDYACILIVGADLVRFIRSNQSQSYFSNQTRKQVEIGLSIAEWSKNDEKPIESLVDVVNQCLRRDDGWKAYYKNQMDKLSVEYSVDEESLAILEVECKAESLLLKNKFEEAAQTIQKLIDVRNLSDTDRGWYMQVMARYKYYSDKTEANRLQKAAFEANTSLLKPRNGIAYKKFKNVDTNRIVKLQQELSKYPSHEELMLEVDSIYENLAFGIEADRFEDAVDRMGRLLGFETQRPDKMIRKGPDNLWKMEKGRYLLIECKNQVCEAREAISKHEVGQMENHCGWFESNYPDGVVRNIIIIPTNKVADDANFTHDVRAMTKMELVRIKDNFRKFYVGLKKYNLSSLDMSILCNELDSYELDIKSIEDKYAKITQR